MPCKEKNRQVRRMVNRLNCYKYLILIAVIAIGGVAHLFADWQMGLSFSNLGTGGSYYRSSAYLGEHSSATNGYDWNYDIPASPAPNNPGYVRIFFPHTDWGAYNGNFRQDIRATNPLQKTWNITLAVNTALSTNYMLEWSIPIEMPDYFQPKLLIGSSTINMRNQTNHIWTGFLSTCAVRLDLATGMPYLKGPLPELLFSNNYVQSLNLNRYFAVLSGSLNFSFSSNPLLEQSLVAMGDSLHWTLSPVYGFVGTTNVVLSATGSGGTKTATVYVIRDSTNSPPQLVVPAEPVHIWEGSGDFYYYGGSLSDPDLDPIQMIAHENEELVPSVFSDLQAVFLLPAPGIKGYTGFFMEISDGINNPQSYEIPVYVNPLEPHPVTEINFIRSADGSLVLSWTEVESSVNGTPLYDLEYRITGYADASCTQQLFETDTADTELTILNIYPRLFLKISVINE